MPTKWDDMTNDEAYLEAMRERQEQAEIEIAEANKQAEAQKESRDPDGCFGDD